MARLFIDGFESGGYDLYTGAANASVISSTGKDMDGSYCLDLTTVDAYVYETISATGEIYTSVLWRPSAPSALQPIFRFDNGILNLATLYRDNSTNKLHAFRGSSSIDIGTKTISNDTTYLIEVYLKIANSGGRFVVKVDDVTDIDFTGDTQDSTYTVFTRIYLGRDDATYTAKAYFDNFKIDDADYPGDANIQVINPTGAGNTTAWTPSVGANWQCVDELPASDVDYVTGTADKDTYISGNLLGDIASIKCLQVQARSKYVSFANPINLVVRSASTDYLSGDNALTSSWESHFNIWETNPADSAAWEEADVNAVEIGISSSVGNTIYASQVLAQVEWAELNDIDETLRSLTITSTVAETDLQIYVDTALSVSLSMLISEIDLQDYSDNLLVVVILVTADLNDFLGFYELERLVNITLGISETDIQTYIDELIIALSLSPSVTDIQTYVETALGIVSALTISVFDSVPFNDTNLLISINSTVLSADNQGYSDSLTIPISMGVTETEIQDYVDTLTVLMEIDILLSAAIYEQMLISMTMSVLEIDGYGAVSTRQAYELISRAKSFELIGRIKTYYLEKG